MPKFHAFVEQKKEEEEKVFFKLEEQVDGEVTLVALDARGERLWAGNIATITSRGTLRLHAGVTEQTGLKLDGSGKVVVETSSW